MTRRRRGVLDSTGRWPEVVTATSRILLVDATLCHFRIGRQPQRSDRTEPWEEYMPGTRGVPPHAR